MKIRAQGIVKMVVGSVASIMVIAAAGSFTAPGIVKAEETSNLYYQTDKFVADDGSKVTIYESQPAPSQPNQNAQGIQQGQNSYQQQPNKYQQQAPQQQQQPAQQPQNQQNGQDPQAQVQPSQNQQSQPQTETPIDGDAGLGTAELVVVE